MLAFSPFEPDRSRYALQASTNILNALPKADGWGPWPSLSALSEALAATPLGVVLVRTFAGAFEIYAGTGTKLYKLDTTNTPYEWTDVTRLSGGDYSVASGYRWSLHQHGAYLFAANGTDALQRINVNTGSNFELCPGSPPVALLVGSAGNHLVLGRIADYPHRVQWSAYNNTEIWTEGDRGASYQDLTTGDEIMAIMGSELGAIIVQRNAIQAMSAQVNATSAFRFDVVNPARGAIAPYSVVNIGSGQFAYLSEQGFHMNVEGRMIGAERVDRWFLDDTVDKDKLPEVQGMLDPYNKLVLWRFQKVDATYAIIAYNYQLDRWAYSTAQILDIAALATPGLTWDGLDNLHATIDDVDQPYDSRAFTGGRPTLAGFNSSFELGWFTGDSQAATLETADTQHAPPYRAFVSEIQSIGDAITGTLQIGTASRLGGPTTWGTAISPFAATGIYHARSSALTHRYRKNIPAGADWTFETGVLPKAMAEGQR